MFFFTLKTFLWGVVAIWLISKRNDTENVKMYQPKHQNTKSQLNLSPAKCTAFPFIVFPYWKLFFYIEKNVFPVATVSLPKRESSTRFVALGFFFRFNKHIWRRVPGWNDLDFFSPFAQRYWRLICGWQLVFLFRDPLNIGYLYISLIRSIIIFKVYKTITLKGINIWTPTDIQNPKKHA